MKLYFAPLACSMASRIIAYEADLPVIFVEIDPKAGRLPDGGDYHAINPMGQVPTLMTDAGDTLSENAAVLQYLADQAPSSGLVPRAGEIARYQLQQWLSFIGTELHKQLFVPLLAQQSNDGAKDFARLRGARPLARLDAHLQENDYLLGHFTVADAYLATVLNWAQYSGVDLAEYPAIEAYYARLKERPSIARAMAEEMDLYLWKKAS